MAGRGEREPPKSLSPVKDNQGALMPSLAYFPNFCHF